MKLINKNKKFGRVSDNQAILIMVIVGVQILYAGYMILNSMLAVLGLDIILLVNPVILFSLGVYAIIIYAGVSFFRGKIYGWYGEASLYIILSLKNILIFISMVTVLLFKESLFKNMPMPAIKLNTNIIWAITEFLISGLMVKLLFSNDTINGFSFRNNSKISIIIKITVIVIVAVSLYFTMSFLLVKW